MICALCYLTCREAESNSIVQFLASAPGSCCFKTRAVWKRSSQRSF